MNFQLNFGLAGLQQLLAGLKQAAQFVETAFAGAGRRGTGTGFTSFLRLATGLSAHSAAGAQLRAYFTLAQTLARTPFGGAVLQVVALAVGLRFLHQALETVVHAVIGAAHRMVSFSQDQARTGGGSGFAAVSSLLGAAGIHDPAGFARSFRDRLASDPFAMSEGARHGMRAFPREFGFSGVSDSQLMLQEVQTLRGFKTEMEALSHAMIMGTEPLLVWQKATDAQVGMWKRLGEETEQIHSEAAEASAVRLVLAMQNLSHAWANLVDFVEGLFVPVLTWAVTTLLYVLQTFKTGFHELFPFLMPLGGPAAGGKADALQSNTAAINNNTRALSKAGRTFGGEAAAHALPIGLRGAGLQHALAVGTARSLGQLRY